MTNTNRKTRVENDNNDGSPNEENVDVPNEEEETINKTKKGKLSAKPPKPKRKS